MSFQTLRPQIKTLLDNSTEFQETSLTPGVEFDGYPAAYVINSDQGGDYETTSENQRIYAFLIHIFYSTKSLGVGTALTRLEKVVDAIIDDIDQDSYKGAASRVIGVSLPAGYTFLNTYATPSKFGELQGEQLLMAEIRLQVKISRDIT
jgi:hypothetical protein